ncbi:hypothetical protein ABPG72_016859 [Tetrahymena utriculariae]
MTEFQTENIKIQDEDDDILSNHMKLYDIEEAIQVVGDSNWYQKRSIIYIWSMFIFMSYMFFLVPSTTYPPTFTCADGSSCTETDGGCDAGSIVDSDKMASAVTEFKLYCDNLQLRNLLQSIGMVGAAFGLLVVNLFSDNFSRKKCIIFVWGFGALFAILYGVTQSVALLIISQFGIGLGYNCLLILFLVQMNELSATYRVMGITVAYAISSLGQISIYFIIMITENWRYQILYFFAIPSAALWLLSFFLIDDQPRFLILKNKEKCVEVLKRIASANGKECPITVDNLKSPNQENNLSQVESQQSKKKYTYYDLFAYKSQRIILFPLMFALFFLSSLYYGTQLSLDSVGFTFQQNCLYIGISELVGYLASDRICSKLRRRKWGIITLFVTSCFLILDAIFKVPNDCTNECYQKDLQMVFTCLARFIVSFSFSFLLIQIGEAFPVTLKSIGYGFITAFSNIGNVISPYLQNLAIEIEIDPLYILGIVGMLSCICIFLSKETFQQPDIQDIPELLESNKNSGINKPMMVSVNSQQ